MKYERLTERKIEEMAKIMCGCDCGPCGRDCRCASYKWAKKLYAAGYRKQSDTVREFVEQLKKELFAKCTYILTVDNPNDYDMKSDEVNALIDELADKYGAEVEE